MVLASRLSQFQRQSRIYERRGPFAISARRRPTHAQLREFPSHAWRFSRRRPRVRIERTVPRLLSGLSRSGVYHQSRHRSTREIAAYLYRSPAGASRRPTLPWSNKGYPRPGRSARFRACGSAEATETTMGKAAKRTPLTLVQNTSVSLAATSSERRSAGRGLMKRELEVISVTTCRAKGRA